MDETIIFNVDDGDRKWKGKLKINEIQEHFCVGEINSRDSNFNVVLSCYFDKYNMQEWCITVPNWDFGCKVSRNEEYWNEEQIAQYIPNKTDRKSLTAGISEMFRIVEQYKMSRAEIKINQEDKPEREKPPEHKNETKRLVGKSR